MTKRLACLTLYALTVSIGAAHAQTLTQQDRDSLVKHLQQTRQAFLDSIANVSDAQWTFKGGADRWSIAEVAEHIAISETTILQIVTDQILKAPAVPRNPNPIPDEKLVAMLLDRTSKFQAPEMLKPFCTLGPIIITTPSSLWAITPAPPPMNPWSEHSTTSV